MEQYIKMIYKIAWSFHRTTGIEFEELVSEATLLAVEANRKFDPENGASRSTFLYASVKNGLIGFTKNNVRHENVDDVFIKQAPESVDFMMELSDLSEAGKGIVAEVLQNKGKFEKNNKIGFVEEHMRSIGWKYQDIWDGIKEIKQVLQTV